jgi:hypothetical protein
MSPRNFLFKIQGGALTPDEIRMKIAKFAYKKATQEITEKSKLLDEDGEVFVRCTARILSNFGMTRGGVFKGVGKGINGNVTGRKILLQCWDEIGDDLLTIRNSIPQSGHSRERYLLELGSIERERLTAQIWTMTKRLLPITMGKTSYGLVGASKILFSVLPEIVLPVDNQQWLEMFKTVDLGDVINRMVGDIQQWENITQNKLNEVDDSRTLTTLPSVYNVMTMDAKRDKN